MNFITKEMWKYIIPGVLALITGVGTWLISQKNKAKNKDDKCKSCMYYIASKNCIKIERQIIQAINVLTELESIAKTDFLGFVVQNAYCHKDHLQEYKPYYIFQSCLDSSIKVIIDVLRSQFQMNKLAKLSSSEIASRANLLFNKINDVFDRWYRAEDPNRQELYDYVETQKPKYLINLIKIYEKAKEID